MNTTNRIWRRFTLSLLVAVSTACADTEIQGLLFNEDIRHPDLMLTLVRGVDSELTDVYRGNDSNDSDLDAFQFLTGAATDEFTNDGTTASEERRSLGNYTDRPGSFMWENTQETAWAGYYAVQVIMDVLPEEEADRSPLMAQALVMSGWAERLLGETFCELVYNYGPNGGALLDGGEQYDHSRAVPRDSAFRRSVTAFTRAVEVAEAAVAAGADAPDDDPIFDPQALVYKAHGGLAQAYADLGEWDQAVAHARQVPDDFVEYEYHHTDINELNDIYLWFFENDDLTLWNTPAVNLWADDPRVPWTKCGEFQDGPRTEPGSSDEEIVDLECGSPSEEFAAESNTIPMYRADKYTSDEDDVAMVKGTEMRLIEAEAALRNGNLGEFTAQINRARAVHGLGPIDQPATAGALEWPNAEDDAWSILDRERYLELWLEGRRYWDLERWDHPFVSENHVMTPRLLDETGGTIQRASCFPLPDIECDANPDLACASLGG